MPQSSLTDFIEEVTGDSHLRVESDLGDGFVVLRVSEAERRQARHDVRSTEDVVIEMLRNARDAHAKNIFFATSREEGRRKIVMLDDGDGVPDHMLDRIFDARVTSKLDSVHIDTWGVHGRGMALYAIRMNTEKAMVAASKVGGGSSFVIESDTSVLPEKTDQSSMPQFIRSENGKITVRGARNIYRTVAEFSYVNRDVCSVFLGSPVEIATTLWEYGRLLLSPSTRAFCDNPDEIEVCKRLALATSPESFARIASSLGLDLSERSARRIINGELAPLAPFVDSVTVIDAADAGKKARVPAKKGSAQDAVNIKDARSFKLAEEDKQALRSCVQSAFSSIAQRYYLEDQVDISVTVRKDAIHISIPVELDR